MELDIGVLRATEDVVDALARLDEQVAGATPGLVTLLKLRSAQAIVAANDRPLDTTLDGDAAFAALLGWWYAPEAREFIADDPHLRSTAVALDAAAAMVRAGRTMTMGLLEEAMRAGNAPLSEMPADFDTTLREAEGAAWSALLAAAALSSGACGRTRSVAASIARATAPLAGGFTTDVFVVAGYAEDVAGALHTAAREARTMQRRVAGYRDAYTQAVTRCQAFGRGAPSASALVDLLAGRPAITVAAAALALDLSAPTAGAAVERLMQAELLREITGRGRDRVFVYTPAVALAG